MPNSEKPFPSAPAQGPLTSRRLFLAGSTALLAAGCSANIPGFDSGPGQQPSQTTLGSGSVKVGLILPLSASGGVASVAATLKNAAEMALAEFSQPNIQLIVKDDRGSPEAAATAAREVIADGAELILGPLLAANVRAVAGVAQPAGKPVIAFSTDAGAAGRGVYLLSFMPEPEVERIVAHAAAQGRRSFAALIPENAYGQVTMGRFQQAVASAGGRVVALERVSSGAAQMDGPVGKVAAALGQADALFIPGGADVLAPALSRLATAGAQLGRVKLIGTSVWNDSRVFQIPQMNGAWFAAPDAAGFNAFAQRYQARFGAAPARVGTLSYDAVSLAAALVRTQGAQRFSESILTNPSGFAGADGVFRFRADGTNDRALAIMEIRGNSAVVIGAAPRSFGA